jgi:hypothetical protein
MTSKRPRRNTGAADTPTDIPDTPDTAVAVIRYLMKQFNINPAILKDDDSSLSLSLSLGPSSALLVTS